MPVVSLPFTDVTFPAAASGRGGGGVGATNTLVASTVRPLPVSPELCVPALLVPPVFPVDRPAYTATFVPTQTLAKLTEDEPGSAKTVLEVTLTATVEPLGVVRVKLPDEPALPHVPEELLPPTDATVPAAAGRARWYEASRRCAERCVVVLPAADAVMAPTPTVKPMHDAATRAARR